AVALVEQTAERVRILQRGLFDERGRLAGAAYRSLKLNFTNVRKPVGATARPLGGPDSIRGLNDTREDHANRLTEYERARFRLLVALGIPASGLLDPRLMPVPPCCKAQESGVRNQESGVRNQQSGISSQESGLRNRSEPTGPTPSRGP